MAEEALRAEFFVTRSDGKMVPLIAVDELPHHIVIAGVSRVMSSFDIAGMTCVGRSGLRHRHHTLQEVQGVTANNTGSSFDVLKAKYFVTRDSGNMVPLVAMDEMPQQFAIEGVLRVLSPFDISGMTCVGLGDARERLHHVEDVKNAPLSYFTRRSSVADESADFDGMPATPALSAMRRSSNIDRPRQGLLTPESSATVLTPPSAESRSEFNRDAGPTISETSSATGGAAGNTPGAHSSAVSEQNTAVGEGGLFRGVKEYCSYWLRHGECDYQQQGCLYKHEMPTDPKMLLRLGLRDIPRWYREKYQLGSFLAADGSGAGFGDQGLRSTVAIGNMDEERRVRLEANWRTGPRDSHAGRFATNGRRGNTYNPRNSRMTTPSGPPIRSATTNQPSLARRKLRNIETLAARQHFETLQALNSHEVVERDFRAGHGFDLRELTDGNDVDASASNGSPRVGRGRDRVRTHSVSTMTTDVEGRILRQDDERKAKEDAHYAEICKAEKRKAAGKDDKDSVKDKTESSAADKRGPGAGGQGGKSGAAKGRGKKVSEKTNNAA